MSSDIQTVILEASTVTHTNEGYTREVPDGPLEWRNQMTFDGYAWVAGVGANAITLIDLTPGNNPNKTFIGTATQGAVDAWKAYHGANFKTGPDAVADGQLAGFLRAQLRDGNRFVRGLKLKGTSIEISFVSPHAVAGHDPIEAALPEGVSRDAVEIDDGVV